MATAERLITQGDVLATLARHQGRANGVHIGDLVREITGDEPTRGLERQVRKRIHELRTNEGSHICGRPETGYFIATTEAELIDTCKFLTGRGISHLRQAYKMRGVALPDFMGQLRLRT